MKRNHWTSFTALLVAATLPLQAQTLIHYTLNDGNSNLVSAGVVPNAGTLGPGVSGGAGISLTNDIPTNGVPTGAGNRAIVCNGAGGVLAPGARQLNNTNIAAGGGFTYEAWFKWNGGGNVNAIIDYAGTQKLVWPTSSTGPQMETDNSLFNLIGAAASNQWHYVAVVFSTNGPLDSSTNITGNYAFYLDTNAPVGFASNITVTTFGDSLNRTIGVGMHPAGFSSDYFNGLIYEPRVTLGALPKASLMFQPFQLASTAPAYSFTTLAGDSSAGSSDGVGDGARFSSPFGVAVDTNGNVYVGDAANNTIRKITPAGVVSTWAGVAGQPGLVNGSIGTNGTARFNQPQGLAFDKSGNLFVADLGNFVIREITPGGQVSSLPGGKGQFVAVDNAGAVYGEEGFAIIKFTPSGPNWVKTTLAGSAGTLGFSNGPAATALFNYPEGLAVDAGTNVYVCDGLPGIRVITAAGIVKTIAGSTTGISNGIGTNAQFYSPFGIVIDSQSNIYVGDGNDGLVRKVTPSGTNWVVSTLAGTPFTISSTDGTGSDAIFGYPVGVTEDSSGNVYVADRFNNNIRKITSAGVVTTLAGPGNSAAYLDGTGAEARFNTPNSVAVDSSGNVYVADGKNAVVRKITSAGVVSTLAGKPGVIGQQDGVGDQALFIVPSGVVTDAAGNIYVTDKFTGGIRKVTPAGVVSTIAGGAGSASEGGYKDGPAGVALFNNPGGIAMDGAGNFYVADNFNNAIRLITTNFSVITIAGTNISGYVDGNGAVARFNSPQGIAVDNAGNLYVAESGNHLIRKIFAPTTGAKTNATNWMVTTLAGVAGATGNKDGTGADALFGFSFYNPGPTGVAIDGAGNLYVTDDGNSTIRGITPAGVVSTLGGLAGVVGNADGTGSGALFNVPFAIAVDAGGALYVSDQLNNTIRKGVFNAYVPANPGSSGPVVATGQLNVTLLPAQAGGQWRLAWETAWRASGSTASNLAPGEYAVQFRNIPGYLTIPLSGPEGVTNGGTTYLTNYYYSTVIPSDTTSGGGSLTVNIGPSPPAGAGWRFLGDTTSYYPPGYATNLLNGTYLIQFAPVARFTTPATLSVQVQPGVPTVLAVTYLLASPAPAGVSLPAAVPPAEITDLNDFPFGYNGQLETDVGYGSGVAVETNVVLTAAHLIFNDQTLSFVSQAYWFYQQETGLTAQNPQSARGWYVLSGYASQRTNDVVGGLGPDQSSPQSRNMDVAALYFESPAANGGRAGFLPSDATPNTWLSSTAEKLLTGYPVDGSSLGVSTITNGLLYVTGPQTAPFGPATDPVADQQVYTASWLLSFPGNSGGPLYVQYDGYYYPAGVYLGSLYNGTVPYASAVRAIDSNVVNLVNLAASLGDTGTNFSGGGVITIIPSLAINANNPGYLLLQLGPAAAVQAGAAWKLASQSAGYYSTANPSLQEIISTNALLVQFKPIPGWNLPSNLTVIVSPNVIQSNTALYTVTNPLLTIDHVNGLGMLGAVNTRYQIQSNSSFTGGTWVPILTNTLTAPGFNLITNKPGPGYYRAVWLTN